jgi:hypothetical protein
MWECEFPNGAALDHFLKVALASSEFEEVRKTMGTLIRKGERKDWEVRESTGERAVNYFSVASPKQVMSPRILIGHCRNSEPMV